MAKKGTAHVRDLVTARVFHANREKAPAFAYMNGAFLNEVLGTKEYAPKDMYVVTLEDGIEKVTVQ